MRFGVQWRITRDEIEATAKLGNYPNIPLDVNDAAELAAFAILPLPCVTVLQSRGHKLHVPASVRSFTKQFSKTGRFLRNYIANLPEDFNGESVRSTISRSLNLTREIFGLTEVWSKDLMIHWLVSLCNGVYCI